MDKKDIEKLDSAFDLLSGIGKHQEDLLDSYRGAVGEVGKIAEEYQELVVSYKEAVGLLEESLEGNVENIIRAIYRWNEYIKEVAAEYDINLPRVVTRALEGVREIEWGVGELERSSYGNTIEAFAEHLLEVEDVDYAAKLLYSFWTEGFNRVFTLILNGKVYTTIEQTLQRHVKSKENLKKRRRRSGREDEGTPPESEQGSQPS